MDDREVSALRGAVHNARIAIGYALTTSDWQDDQKTVDAIAKRLEEVSESLRRVKPNRRASVSSTIRWNEVIGIREVIAHDYVTVDVDVLSGVIENGLPELITQIEAALDRETDPVDEEEAMTLALEAQHRTRGDFSG